MRFVVRIMVILLAVGLLVAGWDFSRFVARADRAVTPDPPLDAPRLQRLFLPGSSTLPAGPLSLLRRGCVLAYPANVAGRPPFGRLVVTDHLGEEIDVIVALARHLFANRVEFL